MTVATDSKTASLPLSRRLKKETHGIHDSLDSRISGLSPFLNRAHYARFLRVQMRFQHATAPLYEDAQLHGWFEGLPRRSRLELIEADCRDLGLAETFLAVDRSIGRSVRYEDPYTAVGWLYTNEGSNLGAAFLFKRAEQALGLSATFGARHLAGHPDGRGLHWKQFKAQLDALPFDDAQRDRAVAGARDAFAFVREAVEQVLARS